MSVNHPSKPDQQSGRQKVILLALAFVALVSVFVLPALVDEPWIDATPDSRQRSAPPASTDVSPSTAAEKTRYRQESQSVLAQIIAVRDRLEEMNVSQWAAAEFSLASQVIETGDEQYSYGEYRESLASYQQALDSFNELETIGNSKLDEALASGFSAIEELNPVIAASSSELALTIAPDNAQANILASRLQKLPELIEQMEAGDRLRMGGDPVGAQSAYQAAVNIDPQHQGAADALAAMGAEIVDSRFRGHMSRAYGALEQGDFEGAKAAFLEAEKVYPGNSAVAQGLAQVENRDSQRQVSAQIRRAAELETQEQWAQALSIYESLLASDASLAEVRVKLIPARVRADLDQRLVDATDDPLGLTSRAAYLQGQQTLKDAQSIPNPGSRLSSQIESLEKYLELALTPVDVVFKSDNQTHVTLFRIAELGRFEQTSMTLRPGRYIVAGTRQGYRDVRVEFTVTGEPLDEPIVVQCLEPV